MRLYASLYLIVYTIFILAIFVLPLYSEGYSIVKHSISELGAQQVPLAWIMNFTFFLLSMATTIFGTYTLKRKWLQLIALYFFSGSLFFTGVYQLAGQNPELIYNYTHDAIHSLFSTMTGFAFCAFCVVLLFILKERKHKIQTLIILVLTIILSVLIFATPGFKGIFQRLLFIGSFGWLFYAFTSYTFIERPKNSSKAKIGSNILEKITRDEK